MEKTKVSVLMSIYFKEKPEYLESALESILDKQILKPNEVVLVKDGPLTQELDRVCLLYTSPSPRDRTRSRMPSSA